MDVAKHQHHAGDVAAFAGDRRGAALDRNSLALSRYQDRVIRERENSLLVHHSLRCVSSRALAQLDELEDFVQRLPQYVGRGPAGQFFGHGIHELNVAEAIGGNHRVCDAPQRGRKPDLALLDFAFQPVFGHRHLEGGVELALLERLEQIAESLGFFGTLDRGVVGVGSQIDDGNVVASANMGRRFDPVHVSVQSDVHQHEVGSLARGHLDGLLSRGHGRRYFVAELLELAANGERHDAFVLHDQNALGCHVDLPLRSCRRRIR